MRCSFACRKPGKGYFREVKRQRPIMDVQSRSRWRWSLHRWHNHKQSCHRRAWRQYEGTNMHDVRSNTYGKIDWERRRNLEGYTYVSRNKPRPSKLSMSRSTQRGAKARLQWSYPCFRIRVQALPVLLLTRSPFRRHTSDSANRKPGGG